jgi:hypothetical protein
LARFNASRPSSSPVRWRIIPLRVGCAELASVGIVLLPIAMLAFVAAAKGVVRLSERAVVQAWTVGGVLALGLTACGLLLTA